MFFKAHPVNYILTFTIVLPSFAARISSSAALSHSDSSKVSSRISSIGSSLISVLISATGLTTGQNLSTFQKIEVRTQQRPTYNKKDLFL